MLWIFLLEYYIGSKYHFQTPQLLQYYNNYFDINYLIIYNNFLHTLYNCDYFLRAVLPLQPELHTAVWHELLREEDQAGEGWKECVRCHKPFIPGSNRQRYCADCGAAAKQARSREKQRHYRERQKTPA